MSDGWFASVCAGIRVRGLEDILKDHREVIVFGAGGSGRAAKAWFDAHGMQVIRFVDNDPRKHGSQLDSVPISPPELLENCPDVPIAIASDWARDISLQLRAAGIDRYFYYGFGHELAPQLFQPEDILRHAWQLERLYEWLADDASRATLCSLIRFRLSLDPAYLEPAPYGQYLHPYVRPVPGDTLVDGGAWAGDTVQLFAPLLEARGHIYAFEPAQHNFERLLDTIGSLGLTGLVTPVQAGLAETSGKRFLSGTPELSGRYRVNDTGTEAIEVLDLDTFANTRETSVHLIKLDIEGAEANALLGARDLLSEQGPKLQVSVYHMSDDLWRLPLWIAEVNPRYRLFLGHHSLNHCETVLYAAM